MIPHFDDINDFLFCNVVDTVAAVQADPLRPCETHVVTADEAVDQLQHHEQRENGDGN